VFGSYEFGGSEDKVKSPYHDRDATREALWYGPVFHGGAPWHDSHKYYRKTPKMAIAMDISPGPCYHIQAMKAEIHPQYFEKVKVTCACGKSWTTGSTKEELNVAICSQCHPFFTGTEKIVDTRGRVEKFKKRLEKSAAKSTSKNSKKK
jgi:large subunit ribosomal protein L31